VFFCRVIPGGKHAETARIIETDALSVAENDIDMVMFAWLIACITDAQGTGHAQVNEQSGSIFEINQQVFGTSPAIGDQSTAGLLD
jgi:hypothetical protein